MSRRRGTVRRAPTLAFTFLQKPGIAPGFYPGGHRGRASAVGPRVDERERAAGTV
jgi:hypothetical protein